MQDVPDIKIEKVHYHDLNELEQMFARAFGEEVPVEQLRQRIKRIRQFYYLLLPLSNMSLWVRNLFNIYVFKKNGKAAGFIQISFLNPTQMHFDYIAVSRQYRGQGLGTWVLRKLLEQVADNHGKDVVLEVKLDNPAYRLYKRLGFTSQARILHYERPLFRHEGDEVKVFTPLPGFRKLKDEDRPKLYRLYRASIPPKLQRVASRDYHDFNPSLFVRNLDWIKNYLMGNKKREYVVERNGSIVASLEIRSYPRARSHIMTVLLHPRYEYLREALCKQAICRLQKRYPCGTVGTAIYDDAISKQQTLERLGFTRHDAYYLMLRQPKVRTRSAVAVIPINRKALRRHYNAVPSNLGAKAGRKEQVSM